MKPFTLSRILFTSIVTLLLLALSPTTARADDVPSTPDDNSHLTLNVNHGGAPDTVDPAKTGGGGKAVIEQIFAGLFDRNDETGIPEPELVDNWIQDGLVYSFTLRADAKWSDGAAVTAHDVRYSLLRVLDPATGSSSAAGLYLIKNGEAYHRGQITDPDAVGVRALSATELEIELEASAINLFDVLSEWYTKPVPQAVVEAHGDAWTALDSLVVSGPYSLTATAETGWTLAKNPDYVDAGNVQIEHVNLHFVDDDQAWQMYLDGELDTTAVPEGANYDAITAQEIRIASGGCTYYFGLNLAQPPLDNPLVRKALASAIERSDLTPLVRGSVPALTFTAPGVFGHVNGYSQGVGLRYDPGQARTWLAEAGYPDDGAPLAIDLWFNEGIGHQTIADFVKESWEATLNVAVTLHAIPWGELVDGISQGQLPIWRLGWCTDYNDALSFLRDGLQDRTWFGGWSNPTYEGLIQVAETATDLDERLQAFKQMEEILVETDVALIPLYYYGDVVAVKPYLTRTFSPFGNEEDFAEWCIHRSQDAIPVTGGSLPSEDEILTVNVAPNSFDQEVQLQIEMANAYSLPANLAMVGPSYHIRALDPVSGVEVDPLDGASFELHYQFGEAGVPAALPVDATTLAFYYWDGAQWQREESSTVSLANNRVVATTDHFSHWAVFGETERLFLPMLYQ